ncbi:MAG: malonyl-ACP O-methyltransferase BioC [Steroidobacteraceae bacterium]
MSTDNTRPHDPGPGVFRLDRVAIRKAFDRASARYEAGAVLQARVGEELLGRLELFKFQPQVVLDLGAGTGRSTEELKRRYRRALVVALDVAPGMLREARRRQHLFRRFERVCADALRLPFADASVDLVFSNLMLQWCDPLDMAFAQIRRVLKPEGFLAFSTFGPDTLKELRAAWADADGYNHVNHFTDMHDVGEALVRAGLMEPVLDVDHIQLTYADTMALMRDLKAIGAHNATAGRSRGLTGRSRIERVRAAYETFRRDGRLPATYEVIYGATWGAAAGRPASRSIGGEAFISPGAIKRRRP